ncbi:MAG: proteasome accessory factor PafA2 family protein [Armatimonadetes bacterium]|nr:proteasome accessory factor PafA2 family protein [Armatimonadota bacterium]
MPLPFLTGIETEYGFLVEGQGAETQVENAMRCVQEYREGWIGWDYRHESPRSDLRGFKLDHLQVDPEDWKFEAKSSVSQGTTDTRADRITSTGARFYNDHGHPEFATPECRSLYALSEHDSFGEGLVWHAASSFAASTGQTVQVYKNNTDFHGASYGTHESYLAPRSLGFEGLYQALLPMLVCRQVLTGAGKVGSETGAWCDYQLSQRADFFVEPFNAETLFRRPIFNTRDEPHADPRKWIRIHVIAGDANMMPSCTRRKVGLLRLALALAEIGEAPIWAFDKPVAAAQSISRDSGFEFEISLEGRSHTNVYEVLESYFAAAERNLSLDEELTEVIRESRQLLAELPTNWHSLAPQVDWAAKRFILEDFQESTGCSPKDNSLQACDLAYHSVDPDASLYYGLRDSGFVADDTLSYEPEVTRAFARGLAVQKFSKHLVGASWSSLTFNTTHGPKEVNLAPDREYPLNLADISDVECFIQSLEDIYENPS